MFGVALSAAGDLNHDGFEDLAVGAPFDGAGKVYIYHGSNLGIVAKPAQVLDGEGVGVTAFGYSQPGPARSSTSPGNVSLLPPNIDLEQSNCQHQEGVWWCPPPPLPSLGTQPGHSRGGGGPAHLTPCPPAAWTSESASATRPVPPATAPAWCWSTCWMLTRTGGAWARPPAGSFLGRRPSDPEHQFSDAVELPRQKRPPPAPGPPSGSRMTSRDKLRPIAVTPRLRHPGSRAYAAEPGGPLSRVGGAPQHSGGGPRKSRGAALPPLSPVAQPPAAQQPPHRGALPEAGLRGRQDLPEQNLQLRFQFCAPPRGRRFPAPAPGADGTAVFAMSDQKDVALEIHVTNLPSEPAEPQRDGDDAHEGPCSPPPSPPSCPTPPCAPTTAGPPRGGSALCPQDKPVVCLANQNGSQVECELGNPMKRGAQVRFFLILSTLASPSRPRTWRWSWPCPRSVSSRGCSQWWLAPAWSSSLPLSAWPCHPPGLFFGGVVRGESAVRRGEPGGGSAVRFEVTGLQPGSVAEDSGLGLLTPPLAPRDQQREVAALPPAPGAGDPPRAAAGSLQPPRQPAAPGPGLCPGHRALPGLPLPAAELRARRRADGPRAPLERHLLEEFLAVTSVELIVRASVSVTSSIKNLVLKDASTQIPVSIYLTPGGGGGACPGGSSCWPRWPAPWSWPCSSSSSGSWVSSRRAALRAAGRAAVPRREDPAGGAAAVPRGEDGHHPEEGVGRQPERGQQQPRRPQLGV
ncbi:unnamed protein product, partial [Bubo scandiacus]